jgi:hypothetical protein
MRVRIACGVSNLCLGVFLVSPGFWEEVLIDDGQARRRERGLDGLPPVHEPAGPVDFHVPGHDRAQFGQVTSDEGVQVPAHHLGIVLTATGNAHALV